MARLRTVGKGWQLLSNVESVILKETHENSRKKYEAQ